jgi:hypothetical protein
VIVETNPAGHSSTYDADGTASNTLDQIKVTLANSGSSTGNDFLDSALYSVSGQIRYDSDNDGDLGDADSGLAGASVALFTDPNGDGNPADGVQVGAAVTTTGTGNYTFPNVVPGKYVVVETSPASYISTADSAGANDDRVPLTVTHADSTGNNFLDTILYSVSGQIRYDSDNDGNLGDADNGLAGASVALFTDPNGDGNPADGVQVGVAVTTTGTGNYTFPNVVPGKYVVVETNPAGYISTADSAGANDDSVPLTITNANSTGNNFLDAQIPGVIGNRIWLDEDGNGLPDAGEAGISGVTVYVDDDGTPGYSAGDSQTVTDSNGNYLLKDLPPGTHTVRVKTDTLPAGLVLIYDEDSGTGSPDGTTSVNLSTGKSHLTADFGYNWVSKGDTDNPAAGATGAIGDRIWNDADGDGVQDSGEIGIVGVTVKLFTDTNGDGVYGGTGDSAAVTTTTGADGRYIFDGLTPGSYVIEVDKTTLPAGYNTTPSSDPDSTRDGKTTNPIILSPGDVFVNADFGYNINNDGNPNTSESGGGHSIGNTIYLDADASGTLTAADSGIAGITVVLEDSSGKIIATTTTDASGSYSFDGLPDGTYTVKVADNSNLLNGLSSTGYPSGGSAYQNSVTLSGADKLDQDFGYAPAGHSSSEGLIGDTVFLDLDNDGIVDAGEGIEGVTVQLYDSTGTTLLQTVVTDQNGQYRFGNINKTATYQVRVNTTTLPNGGAGLNNSVDPDGGTASRSTVNLSVDSDGIVLDQDFGYVAATPNTISGTLWNDTDADGTLEGSEAGRLSGVTIVLHDSSGRIVATTVTDGSGNYSFGNLPNGVYTVDVEDRNGSLEGWWHSDGPNDGVDNNSQVSGYSITVSGAGNSTADFGYYKNTASVGDHIWKDADGDGIFAGEEPMIGQKVSLVISYPNGDKVTVTTVTDATGHYTFATLLADEDYLSSSGANQPTYVIQVEPPTDMRSTHTPATDSSGLDDQANNPEGEFVSLNKGEDVVNKDFAFYFGGAIGDHVWLDIDGDGVQDGNEAPLDGVIVKLYLDGGNGALGGDDTFTTSAVTGIDGSYLFENLPAGTYWVQIDSGVPAGLEVTADATHDNALDQTKPADKVVLPANGSDNTVDFGFSSTAMLGDAIWFDADPDGGGPLLPDGLQNPGEAGIAGVGLFICENDVNPCNGSNDIDTSSTGPTVTTGIDGTWLKTGFTPSATYTVAVDTTTLPAGLDSVPTNGPVRRTYTLPTSGGVLLADYGFADDSTPNYGSIGNRVYFDTDNDSTDDGAATDPGIAGVLVDLLINDGGTWKTVAQTTTGADGKYLFSGLLSGTDYRVQLNTSNSSLADFTATQAPGAGYYTYNSNINGLNYLAADYGFSGTGIGDYVWFDSNSDGIQNGAETGIGGVEVKLYLDNGSVPNQVDAGDTLIRTTTTDSSGHYLFSGVATGQDYVVKVTPPSNFTPSSTGAGTVSTDSNGNANNEAALNFTGTTFDLDFGFKGGTYSIGDFVWLDSDGQGDQDESSGGINGVTVDLYLGGIRIASTVTSGGGHYSFSNLSANTYEVRITDEGNILDNLIATTGGESKTVTLSAGNPAANDIDFGYNYPIPTYALISSFKAYVNDKNQTVLEWKTDSEVGTIGFLLERLNKQRGEYEAISDMLPGMLTPPQGGTYRYVDTAAASDKQHTYRVVEVAVNNQGSVAGPYTVKAEQPLPVSKAMVANSAATGFSLAQQSVTAKQLQRFAVMEQAAQSLATEQKQKTGTVIKLPVAKEGLVYLTAEQLAAASGLKPLQVIQHLKAKKCLVTLQGKAVPALFSANGAALWFYGQTPTRNDIGRNTYWLELGKKGVTISVAPQAVGEGPAFSEESFIDRIKVEENHLPIHLYINKPVNDFWAWKYLLASGEKASSIHSVITPDFAGSGTAMLAVNLVNISSENSGTAAPYKVTLFLNGVDIGMAETTTTGDWQIRKPISASLLRKTNEVKIVSQLNTNVSYSLIYLDSIEMEYQRKYQAQQGSLTFTSGRSSRVITEGFNGSAVLALDITDPDKPVRVRAELDKSQSGSYAVTMPTKPDHRYFVTENISPAAAGLTADTPSSLRSTANQADYLIISPLHLLESAKRLADRRQSQGLTAMVVDIEDVQDEFSHGLAAPEAVHEFLTYVHAKWAKSPRYVALAGDGSYDYRNYLGYGWPLVPSLLVATPEGFFPSDNALADVVGDDGIPEFAVGRIPVFDKAEFEKYIDKVISYEQTVHAAGKKLVVVNDKTDAAAGDFKASADLVANLKPEQMAVMRLDVNTLGYTAVGDQIKATMQQGIGILHYIGHSSLIGFGKSNSLLSASKIDALNPVGSPLLMVSMSCSAASFGYPVMNSIGESAVLRANGAAVGFYGATGLSKNYLADIIAEGFYRNLADPSGTHRIGDAVFQSKQHYVEVKHGHDTYMLDIYNLLGDPAVQMTTQQ